jgi:hypothetical protein
MPSYTGKRPVSANVQPLERRPAQWLKRHTFTYDNRRAFRDNKADHDAKRDKYKPTVKCDMSDDDTKALQLQIAEKQRLLFEEEKAVRIMTPLAQAVFTMNDTRQAETLIQMLSKHVDNSTSAMTIRVAEKIFKNLTGKDIVFREPVQAKVDALKAKTLKQAAVKPPDAKTFKPADLPRSQTAVITNAIREPAPGKDMAFGDAARQITPARDTSYATYPSTGSNLVEFFRYTRADDDRTGVERFCNLLANTTSPYANTDAVALLFHLRDPRDGTGDRFVFRNIIDYLVTHNPALVRSIMHLSLVYGRADDMLYAVIRDDGLLRYFAHMASTHLCEEIMEVIRFGITETKSSFRFSLLAKWLKNEGSAYDATAGGKWMIVIKTIAYALRDILNEFSVKISNDGAPGTIKMSANAFKNGKIKFSNTRQMKQLYRVVLTMIRTHTQVAELYISGTPDPGSLLHVGDSTEDPIGRFKFDYGTLPSRSFFLNMNVLGRLDAKGFEKHIDKIASGGKQMNVKGSTIVDLVYDMHNIPSGNAIQMRTYELAWKAMIKRYKDALADIAKVMVAESEKAAETYKNSDDYDSAVPMKVMTLKEANTLISTQMAMMTVLDTSGSMRANCSNSVRAGDKRLLRCDVAAAICLFLSEVATESFHDLTLSFASQPAVVELMNSETHSLVERLAYITTGHGARQAEGYSTDLVKLVRLVVSICVKHKLKTAPRLIIVTDEGFNSQIEGAKGYSPDTRYRSGYALRSAEDSLNGLTTILDECQRLFADAGVEWGGFVYWNVADSNGPPPATASHAGINFLSGYNSQKLVSLVDPVHIMKAYLDCQKENMKAAKAEIAETAARERREKEGITVMDKPAAEPKTVAIKTNEETPLEQCLRTIRGPRYGNLVQTGFSQDKTGKWVPRVPIQGAFLFNRFVLETPAETALRIRKAEEAEKKKVERNKKKAAKKAAAEAKPARTLDPSPPAIDSIEKMMAKLSAESDSDFSDVSDDDGVLV